MSKPSDIPKDVWDEAFLAMPPISREAYERSPFSMVLHLGFARAIMAAEKRGEERERAACAKVADESGINPFNGPAHDVVSKEIAVAIRKRGEV